MRRTVMLLVVLAAASLFSVLPSRAQFVECTPGYVGSFAVPAIGGYPAYSPGDIDCHEFFRFEFSTPYGPRWIRAIGDRNVASVLPAGGLAAVEAAAHDATSAMSGLGDFDIEHVTILISSARPGPPSEEPKSGYSDAWTLGGQAECHVTLFIQSDFSANETKFTLSHELFHCIQQASLTVEQNATQVGHGLWWIEGSADLFAAIVAGAQDGRWPRGASFDRAVRLERPLYAMTYEAAIFFYWEHQINGIGWLMPFLDRMAPSATEQAQRDTLRHVTTREEMLQFAQAYDDHTISYPGGGLVHFGDRIEGDRWPITESSRWQRTFKPFVITLGWIDYACGRWNNTAEGVLNYAVRPESGRDWGHLPSEVDATGGVSTRYRLIAMHRGDDLQDLTLEVERTEACTECIIPAVIDRCAVGRWRLTAGGPMEWLRSQGVPFVRTEQSEFRMTLNDDGTYSTDPFSFDFRAEYRHPRQPMAGEGTGDVQGTTGRWAASEGRFYGCVDSGGDSDGTATVESDRGRGTASYSNAGPMGVGGASTYTCNATTLYTESPMPRGGMMTHTFTRESPPPRR